MEKSGSMAVHHAGKYLKVISIRVESKVTSRIPAARCFDRDAHRTRFRIQAGRLFRDNCELEVQ